MSDLGLREAVYALLAGDSALGAVVTGVFEAVPEGTAEPYVTLATTLERTGHGGRTYRVEATVWSGEAGDKEANAVGASIAAVLDGRVVALDDGAEAVLRLVGTGRLRDDRLSLLGLVQRYEAVAAYASPLTITGPLLLAPYAALGVDCRLTPIDRGTLWRDVNGTARFSGILGHRKYRLTLSGGMVAPPAFAALWRGQAVTVGLPQAITVAVAAGTNSVVLERTPVAGSVAAVADDGSSHAVTDVSGATVTLAAHAGGPVWVRYRPELEMLVEDWSGAIAAWSHGTPWDMALVEV
ncbi:MAG: hypothetical protein CMM50_18665 [Rhodospirillaceae bacterium]|nr:hypothetical protein [Rhodospirillaceae bacterium]